jgi:hypothetical protein
MTMNLLDDKINLSLSKAECLTLFELLTKSYEIWRTDNPNDSSAAPLQVNAVERAQRVALWRLEGTIESTVVEVFAPNYVELVAASKALLERDSKR